MKWRFCLGDRAIPFERETLDLHDLHDQANGDIMDQEFLLLSIKATAEMGWLEKAFKLHTRWWVKNQWEILLLLEIRQAIDSKKVKSGINSRMPRLPNAIVAIRIREKVILVQNRSQSLCLAFKPGEEVETLQWFLEELEKDLEKMQDQAAAPQGPQKQRQKHCGLGDEEAQVAKTSLEKVKGHPQCLNASYLPSRSSIKVIKKDKNTKQFFVKGLVVIRKKFAETEADETMKKEALDPVFDKVVTSALVFLDGGDDDGDGEDAD
jgi:hypothetical protein